MIPPPPELDPAATPDDLLHLPLLSPLEWVLLLSILGVILALVIILLRKYFFRKKIVPLGPGEIAAEKIRDILASSPDLKTASVQLSLIFRSYLTGKAEDPALYETQQEFNRRGDALASIPLEFQNPSRELLDQMARLKYEPRSEQDDQKVKELATRTVDLINGIDSATKQPGEETDITARKRKSPRTAR